LNDFGFYLRKVAKRKPKKKLPETNAIFEEVHRAGLFNSKGYHHNLGDGQSPCSYRKVQG